MTEEVQSPATVKQGIRDALMGALYAPVHKKNKERIDRMIMANSVYHKSDVTMFMHKNVLYKVNPQDRLPRVIPRLAPQFIPEMNQYLKEIQELNEEEIPVVVGYITQVLNSSNRPRDFLRLFPESVHKSILALCEKPNQAIQKPLSDEAVAALLSKNQLAVAMMKQRMVTNLLI